MMNILYLIPKNLFSQLVGFLVHLPLPGVLRRSSIAAFGKFYNINFAEAEKSIDEYSSIGDFFVRRLKPGLRPLANSKTVHPADSKISQIGRIREGQLIQAKDKLYSVQALLDDPSALARYDGGLFATYYLCPTDYHRVHFPVSGGVTSVTHLPGALWPVNEWSVARINELFCVNERVVVEMETELGPVALVMVGATNVGKISVSFEPKILSNQLGRNQPDRVHYSPPHQAKKGEEVGAFHMGSTVVMVYPPSFELIQQEHRWHAFLGQSVKVGEAFL